MIHTGFLVRGREVEDRFYRDILGFRLFTGMEPIRLARLTTGWRCKFPTGRTGWNTC